jgi:four helix bundle protein
MRDYTKILAWQKADDLAVAIYSATREFPREEVYGLTSQLRRAAYSVPANIAEGSARESKKDYLHFLYVARASLTEAQYFIHLSQRLGYLDAQRYSVLMDAVQSTFRPLHGLIRAVEKEANPLQRVAARVTSLLLIACSGSSWSVVRSLLS